MCSTIVIKMSQCDDTLSQLLNKSAEMEITDMCSDTQYSDRSVMADNGQWSAVGQNRKRQRQNTGSVELDNFTSFSLDEKLNALFTKVINIENSQTCVQTIRRTVDEHEKQITNLTYRMLNLEVLNKNRNLVIYGVDESRDDDIYEVVQCFCMTNCALILTIYTLSS